MLDGRFLLKAKNTFYQTWFIWSNIALTMSCHISSRSKVVYESRNMLSGYVNSKVILFLPSITHQNIHTYNSPVCWGKFLLCQHQSPLSCNFQGVTSCILIFKNNNNDNDNYPIHGFKNNLRGHYSISICFQSISPRDMKEEVDNAEKSVTTFFYICCRNRGEGYLPEPFISLSYF